MPSPTTDGASSTTDYEELTYDAGGNVTNRRLRDGTSIAMTYDALGRPTLKNLPGSEPDVSYGYDLLGRMTSAATSAQTLTFTHDALGRQLTETGPIGTMTSTYDAAGRRTQLTYPGSFYVNYDHLVTGEVSAIRENGATSGAGVLATFGYDGLGRRTSIARGNGAATGYAYDAVGRLSSLSQDLSGTTNDLTLTFSHNPAGQIAGTTRSNDAYSFTNLANSNAGDSHNGLNQVTQTGAANVAHEDGRGNTTSVGSTTYSYNSENMLTGTSGGAQLSYDPLLRLRQMSTGSSAPQYLYDGATLVGVYDDNGNLVRRFVHGPGVDEPLVSLKANGERRHNHADERGSLIATSKEDASLVSSSGYDEYGATQTPLGWFGYTGQMHLSEVGLYHYKARMYHPGLGRFLQADPIGYGDGMNLYAYVSGDSINWRDPRGTSGQCIKPVGTNICRGSEREAMEFLSGAGYNFLSSEMDAAADSSSQPSSRVHSSDAPRTVRLTLRVAPGQGRGTTATLAAARFAVANQHLVQRTSVGQEVTGAIIRVAGGGWVHTEGSIVSSRFIAYINVPDVVRYDSRGIHSHNENQGPLFGKVDLDNVRQLGRSFYLWNTQGELRMIGPTIPPHATEPFGGYLMCRSVFDTSTCVRN